MTWYGVLAPAGTPKEIIGKLNSELVKIVRQPEMQERLTGDGGEAVGGTPEEFASYLKTELVNSAKLVKMANVRVE